MNLTQALEFKDGEVVALTGAGGKTTIMFALARELMVRGNKVIITTTTKIMAPSKSESPALVIADSLEKALKLTGEELQKHPMVIVGTNILQDGKLVGIPPEWVEQLKRIAGVNNVLVEADGAAGKPFKAPREYEPIITQDTNLVLSVVGIDALDRELIEINVHRVDRVTALTGLKRGEKITAEAIALVMLHPQGNIKGSPEGARIIPLINKVDDNDRLLKARDLARILIKHGAKQVVLAHAAFEPEVVEVIYG